MLKIHKLQVVCPVVCLVVCPVVCQEVSQVVLDSQEVLKVDKAHKLMK
jgi:hypothetical protein